VGGGKRFWLGKISYLGDVIVSIVSPELQRPNHLAFNLIFYLVYLPCPRKL
jgi:hypothetical protein